MARITETLTLEDRFSAAFTRFLQLGEKAAELLLAMIRRRGGRQVSEQEGYEFDVWLAKRESVRRCK